MIGKLGEREEKLMIYFVECSKDASSNCQSKCNVMFDVSFSGCTDGSLS